MFEKLYELKPTNGQRSFYGKAVVKVKGNGTEVLQSYETDVIKRLPNGNLVRLWDGWSATTGKHVYAFCGIRKAEWDKMELNEEYSRQSLL